MAQAAAASGSERYDYNLSKVIFAASSGTMIEWYDFYIFGSLATILAPKFFGAESGVVGFLSTLATFATGFLIRPFGAAIFGRIGDMIGRKFTFILTISIMGTSTFLIGLLPTYDSIGLLAPLILLILRLAQGAALGGEYGGAAIYVAEHAPDNQRGFHTSFIQTTATLGLLLALAVVVGLNVLLGETAFGDWGWRLPFLLSAILVGIALYIRLSLKETPLFAKLKDEKKTSRSPLKDSFQGGAWKLMLLALVGATAGQAVVWYTGQFYALFFLQNTDYGLGIDLVPSSVIVGIAIILSTPFFLFFGRLSDRIGRKPIILGGCLIAALTYIPIYQAMISFADNYVVLTLLVFIQILYVTAVYGPIAAFLVELFPTKVRYTSLSLPYHIGNGWFGGLTPLIASFLAVNVGVLWALAYPIGIALVTVVVGSLYIRETKDVKIWDDVEVAMRTAAGGKLRLEEEPARSTG